MLSRFIEAFKDVVCAPTETQMRALWTSMFEGGPFPRESVEYLKREYYETPKARQFMECYVFDAGNLHQTTTSRNEGTHRAIRANAGIVSKMSTSYRQRRQRNIQYMQELRAKAIRSSNRLDLDIELFPELREIARKVSLFALREIRQQISQARDERREMYEIPGTTVNLEIATLSVDMDCLVGRWYLQMGLPFRWIRSLLSEGSTIGIEV